MAIQRELTLKPADIDRISVQCKSCRAQLELSIKALNRRVDDQSDQSDQSKKQQSPADCPSCGDDWREIHAAVDTFARQLKRLEEFRVTFRIPDNTSTGAA